MLRFMEDISRCQKKTENIYRALFTEILFLNICNLNTSLNQNEVIIAFLEIF